MTFFLRAGFFCFFCIFGVGFLGVENYVVGFRYNFAFFFCESTLIENSVFVMKQFTRKSQP